MHCQIATVSLEVWQRISVHGDEDYHMNVHGDEYECAEKIVYSYHCQSRCVQYSVVQ